MKNWQRKGALRFMVNILLFSHACFATFIIDGGDTVRKKPWKADGGSAKERERGVKKMSE